MNGNRSGKREHEGGWGGEIVGETRGCLWRGILIGSKDPLLLLKVNDVGKAGGSGDFYWKMSKVVPCSGLRKLVCVGEKVGLEDGKVLSSFGFPTDCV